MCFSLDEFQLKDWKWLDQPSSEIALLLVLLRDWALVEVHVGQGGGGGGDSRRRSWTWSWERAACGAWAGSWAVLHLGRVVVSKRRCWRKLGAKVWDLRSAGGSSWRTRLFTFDRSSIFFGQYFNSHLQNKHISHDIFLNKKHVCAQSSFDFSNSFTFFCVSEIAIDGKLTWQWRSFFLPSPSR